MDEDVYMVERLGGFLLSLDASAVGTGVVLVPASARMSAVDVVTGFADQTAAETTFDLCNTS